MVNMYINVCKCLQINIDMYVNSGIYHAEYFHCSKNPLFSACLSLPFPSPQQPLILLLSPEFYLFPEIM